MSASYRLAVIVSHFNRAVTENLLAGVRTACEEFGIALSDDDVCRSP